MKNTRIEISAETQKEELQIVIHGKLRKRFFVEGGLDDNCDRIALYCLHYFRESDGEWCSVGSPDENALLTLHRDVLTAAVKRQWQNDLAWATQLLGT